MKITELKCTACHGTLKVDESNPKLAICEYCGTKHFLEYDSGDNVRFGSNEGVGQGARSAQDVPVRPAYIGGSNTPSQPPASPAVPTGLLTAACIGVMVAIIGAISFGNFLSNRNNAAASKTVSVDGGHAAQARSGQGEMPMDPEEGQQGVPLTGALAGMVESALGIAPDSVTAADLDRFRWIEVQYTFDWLQVGYSFDNPFEDPEASLTWINFPRDGQGFSSAQISQFTGLAYLGIPYASPGDLAGLKLQGLGCNADSLAELAGSLDDAGQLQELVIDGTENLDGLEQFKGLKRLTLDGYEVTDISALAGAKQLESLALVDCDEVTDFSVLHVMTWLKELSVESEALKDFSFISKMPELVSFEMLDADILNLDGLKGNEVLTALAIVGCDNLKDLSVVSGLTGLKHLKLEAPYNAVAPDLSGLAQLETLSIKGLKSTAFLQNMAHLQELEITNCDIDKPLAFTALQNLKRLSCRSIDSYDTEWDFVKGVPALESLDITGVVTYKDISPVFNCPALKELDCSGVSCELDFAKLQPSESLGILRMDGMVLYNNVRISGGGGIVSIEYDDVVLGEHLDFISNYPNLQELSMAENKLVDISFAESLYNLERVDISGNYVTDLKPLVNLPKLEQVVCTGNPVGNYRVLSEDVVVLR